MPAKDQIIKKLKQLTGHQYLELLERGNSAIWSALQAAKNKVLIPEEGGWLTYRDYPQKLKLKVDAVKTNQAIIDLTDLEQKSKGADAFIYQNPGGYFAEQPLSEIYQICRKNQCLVILDISGGIGIKLVDGKYADIIVCSFGQGKLVNAKVGGFISCKDQQTFIQIKPTFKLLTQGYETILEQLVNLDKRIQFLLNKRKEVIADLAKHNIIHKNHLGFVLVVAYSTETEKKELIDYCHHKHLEYNECPRYIRLNQKAISIEIKRLTDSLL